MTFRTLYRDGARLLTEKGIEDADFDALQLLLAVCKTDRTGFLLHSGEEAGEDAAALYRRYLDRRIQGEPLQYILGVWDFLRFPFYVGKGVLIPRPETEELAQRCIDDVKQNGRRTVFDLCSGSGCIGISIALECPECDVWLFELYEDAAIWTEKNIAHHRAGNCRLIRADVLHGRPEGLPAPDLIVSNPPYIGSGEIRSLSAEVRNEPLTALDGGEDGLLFYRAIAEGWLPFLQSGGTVAVECGEGQTGEICRMFASQASCVPIRDLYGADRFVVGTK